MDAVCERFEEVALTAFEADWKAEARVFAALRTAWRVDVSEGAAASELNELKKLSMALPRVVLRGRGGGRAEAEDGLELV